MTGNQTRARQDARAGDDSRRPARAFDTLIRITSPPIWAALVVLVVIVAAMLTWAFLGELREDVNGGGMVLPAGGVTTVPFGTTGQLRRYEVRVGDRVAAGDRIAVVLTPKGPRNVTASRAGTVVQLSGLDGQTVSPTMPAALLGSENDRLEALGFIPFEDSGRVRPGQEVELSSATQSGDGAQRFKGTVASVSALPVTSEQITATVGSEQLAAALVSGGPLASVTVRLQSDPDTRSGVAVSNAHGAEDELAVGALVQLEIVVDEKAPIAEVFH